jgi:hypothetical protein
MIDKAHTVAGAGKKYIKFIICATQTWLLRNNQIFQITVFSIETKSKEIHTSLVKNIYKV